MSVLWLQHSQLSAPSPPSANCVVCYRPHYAVYFSPPSQGPLPSRASISNLSDGQNLGALEWQPFVAHASFDVRHVMLWTQRYGGPGTRLLLRHPLMSSAAQQSFACTSGLCMEYFNAVRPALTLVNVKDISSKCVCVREKGAHTHKHTHTSTTTTTTTVLLQADIFAAGFPASHVGANEAVTKPCRRPSKP